MIPKPAVKIKRDLCSCYSILPHHLLTFPAKYCPQPPHAALLSSVCHLLENKFPPRARKVGDAAFVILFVLYTQSAQSASKVKLGSQMPSSQQIYWSVIVFWTRGTNSLSGIRKVAHSYDLQLWKELYNLQPSSIPALRAPAWYLWAPSAPSCPHIREQWPWEGAGWLLDLQQ